MEGGVKKIKMAETSLKQAKGKSFFTKNKIIS